MTYAAARTGMGYFLYILGVLNINLGVMNLLPVPVLDGGHLMFAVIEKVRGKPVNEKIRSIASYVGLALIIATAPGRVLERHTYIHSGPVRLAERISLNRNRNLTRNRNRRLFYGRIDGDYDYE